MASFTRDWDLFRTGNKETLKSEKSSERQFWGEEVCQEQINVVSVVFVDDTVLTWENKNEYFKRLQQD